MGISLKTSFCKLGCSSLMRIFSLFVNVGVGSLSIFFVKTSFMKLSTGFFHIIVFVHDNNTASFISEFNHNVIVTFQVMYSLTLVRRMIIVQFDG